MGAGSEHILIVGVNVPTGCSVEAEVMVRRVVFIGTVGTNGGGVRGGCRAECCRGCWRE